MKERQERPENLILKNAMKLAEAVFRSDESPEDIKDDIENIKRYVNYPVIELPSMETCGVI